MVPPCLSVPKTWDEDRRGRGGEASGDEDAISCFKAGQK